MIDLKPACRRMIDLLAGVADDQLADSTPCPEYTVGDLIDHIDQVGCGFAAVAGQDLGTRDDAEPSAANLGAGWRNTTAEHVEALGAAWDDPAAWRGTSNSAGLKLPNERWGRIALTEVVVHGWDLARATGQPFYLPEDTVRACLDHVTEFVPKAPVPELWGPAIDVPEGATLLDRVVAATGRVP